MSISLIEEKHATRREKGESLSLSTFYHAARRFPISFSIDNEDPKIVTSIPSDFEGMKNSNTQELHRQVNQFWSNMVACDDIRKHFNLSSPSTA